ncbi:MAG: cyclic pyranopterin monophosphate synthase accessory protein [Gammaproteobacteria bacterium]|nr:MAG: cyclic pyranopterin monophosphate synthase accessory protein [Gammaproteobacteria bacterium]GIT51598.1 MAG: cyclic pyranopterin monophosphate synthase accessory protein [Gemmatimonadota bacterium]
MKDSEGLTHIDNEGRPRMVDVSEKQQTARHAVATGRIITSSDTLERIMTGSVEKGSVVQVAELAGIMGGKKTHDLIPLCHQLNSVNITMRLEADPDLPGIIAQAEATVTGQTGVEMEALTAVSIALLTVYDMAKSIDRGMRIEGIRLLSKKGGRSGSWTSTG